MSLASSTCNVLPVLEPASHQSPLSFCSLSLSPQQRQTLRAPEIITTASQDTLFFWLQQLLLKQIPTCFALKFRAYSLLSRCYQLVGTLAAVKHTLKKGLELPTNSGVGDSGRLWAWNFTLQLAKALTAESDFPGALRVLECVFKLATAMIEPQLEMVFATAMLHVQLMQKEDPAVIQQSLALCDQLFQRIPQHLKRAHGGGHVYKEPLYIFYLPRACEYKDAQDRVADLDATLRDLEQEIPEQQPVFDPVVYEELQNQLQIN